MFLQPKNNVPGMFWEPRYVSWVLHVHWSRRCFGTIRLAPLYRITITSHQFHSIRTRTSINLVPPQAQRSYWTVNYLITALRIALGTRAGTHTALVIVYHYRFLLSLLQYHFFMLSLSLSAPLTEISCLLFTYRNLLTHFIVLLLHSSHGDKESWTW